MLILDHPSALKLGPSPHSAYSHHPTNPLAWPLNKVQGRLDPDGLQLRSASPTYAPNLFYRSQSQCLADLLFGIDDTDAAVPFVLFCEMVGDLGKGLCVRDSYTDRNARPMADLRHQSRAYSRNTLWRDTVHVHVGLVN